MMHGVEGPPLPRESAAQTEVIETAAGSIAEILRAETISEAGSTGCETSLGQKMELTRPMGNRALIRGEYSDANSLKIQPEERDDEIEHQKRL